VIVGDADDLMADEFEIDRVNWHPAAAVSERADNKEIEATVKIRYNHPGTPATITALENDRARIRLAEPQRAVSPGQAAVIYNGDMVLGGGWICRRQAPVPV
jgi:tRNA-specific 2-thiouridylase